MGDTMVQQCSLQMENVQKYVKVAGKGSQGSSKRQAGSTPDPQADGRSRDVKFSPEGAKGDLSIEEQETKIKKLEEEVKAEKNEWKEEKKKLTDENTKLRSKVATYRNVR